MNARFLAVVATLASAVFFGLNAVASKVLYAPSSPAHFDAVSLFTARGFWSCPLFLILAFAARPRPMPKATWKTLGLLALCGVIFGPCTIASSAIGAYYTSGSHAVLLVSLVPPLAAVLAAVFLRERLPAERIIAILVGVAGAAILTLSRSANGSTLFGDFMICLFALSWAMLTVGIRVLERSYQPAFAVGVFGTIGCALLFALGSALGRFDSVLIPLHHTDMTTIIWFDLELGILISIGGQVCQAIALRTLNVGTVAAITSYGSIFAGLVGSIVILREQLTASIIIAALVLSTAMALALIPESLLTRLRWLRQPTSP